MMEKYYFLASLLPELQIGHIPQLGVEELKDLIRINADQADKERVHTFLRMIDFENFRAIWAKEPIDWRGNLTEEELQQALKNRAWPDDKEFPDYLMEYLDKYPTDLERLSHFSWLMSRFFQDEASKENGFLAEYFNFQRQFRLVMVAFRSKAMGMDIVSQLNYEDPKDPIVAQILAQRDSKVFEPPFEYRELRPIFEQFGDQPLELYKALYEYQFRHIVERWGGAHFTIDRILNYLARLILVERWQELDVQTGIKVVDSVERKVR